MTETVVERERELSSLSLLTTGIVLATVTMTFGAMITVFIVRSGGRQFWGHAPIPPVLWLSTALLLASSFTLRNGRRDLAINRQMQAHRKFAVTTALGLSFLICQMAAWVQVLHSGILLAANPHSWFIFLFMALHGAHILLGLCGLAYLLVRTREPASGPKYQMKTRVVARGVTLFWHYLDFLWIVLFALLLSWRR